MQTFKKQTHTTKFSMFPSLLKKLKIMCKNPHYLKCQKYKNFYSRKKISPTLNQHSAGTPKSSYFSVLGYLIGYKGTETLFMNFCKTNFGDKSKLICKIFTLGTNGLIKSFNVIATFYDWSSSTTKQIGYYESRKRGEYFLPEYPRNR